MCGCASPPFTSPHAFTTIHFRKGNEIRAHVCAHNLVSSLKSLRVKAGHDASANSTLDTGAAWLRRSALFQKPKRRPQSSGVVIIYVEKQTVYKSIGCTVSHCNTQGLGFKVWGFRFRV